MRDKIQISTFIVGFFMGLSTLFGQNIVHTSIYSAALDSTINVDVYLPPGYAANPDTYYPLVIYMHGWAEDQGAMQNIANNAETLINAGTIDPLVMVCADNSPNPFDGNMYMNSPVWGDWETFTMNDLIPWIEENYRVMPFRKYQGIIGESMGAYGALRYGIEQKTKFAAVAGHAAPLGLDVIIEDLRQEVENENTGPPYFYDYDSAPGHFTKVIFLGAGAFSPNLNTPQTYVDPRVVEFPFDDSCHLIDTVFSKWMVQELSNRVRSLTTQDSVGILFGDGTNDALHFYPGNLAFRDTLNKIGIPYKFYSHNGGHSMPEAFQDLSLEFLDSLMLPPVLNPVYLCIPPSDLYVDNIGQTSADLGWTENGQATAWEIMLDTAGFDTLNKAPVTVALNPYHWIDLIPGTDYDWYVRSNCGTGDSSVWVGPNAFQTLCAPYVATFVENFDKETVPELPNCWSSITRNTSALVQTVDSLYYSSGNAVTLYNASDTLASVLLITPEFSDLSSQNNRIRFMSRTWQDTCSVIIGTMSDPADTLTFHAFDTIVSFPKYQEFIVDFDTSYKISDNYIAFKHGQSGTSRYIYIDNFNYETIPCAMPDSLFADSLTRTTANLNWKENGFAQSWLIMVDTAGFDTTGYSPVTITGNPYKATGLTSNTGYDWYVKSYCGFGDSLSGWVGPNTFTTRCDPFTVPFTEPFDGLDTLPDCWFTLTNDQLAKVSLSDSLAWSDSLAAGLYGGQDTTKFVALIAPEVSDLVSQDNRIRFMARTYTDTATLVVGTMSDPFDTLAFTGYDTLTILPVYNEYTVMFDTNYKLTDEYITFKHGMSGKSQSIFLDDISYEVIPCVLPDSLYADSVAPTAAKLFWTEHNFAKNWEMMIDTAGFDTTGVTPETVYENPYVRTGLRPNTSYEWYIKTCCNVGDTVSQWTGPSTFTTRSLTRKAPYLLYDGVDTAMQLNWQLNDSASCTIDWGVDLNYDSTAQTIEYGDDHQHQYTFAGLSEDTKYYYQVTIGNEIYTGDFKTAPPETSTKFSFFAYGDTRTNPAAHDSVAEKILENIQNDTAAQTFILASGDLVANGDNEADWDDQFFDPQYANIQEMLRTLPYMACMGNHERQGTGFGKYFPYVFYNSPRFYGSFDYANAHFIIIDQYTDYSSGSDQYIWLENDLAGTNKPWKIIVLHEPGWTAGGHANNTDVQDYIQPLCETYNVQFVFGGHNHYYARAEVNGVIHITTGGGEIGRAHV